jgi:hypothetical protein
MPEYEYYTTFVVFREDGPKSRLGLLQSLGWETFENPTFDEDGDIAIRLRKEIKPVEVSSREYIRLRAAESLLTAIMDPQRFGGDERQKWLELLDAPMVNQVDNDGLFYEKFLDGEYPKLDNSNAE